MNRPGGLGGVPPGSDRVPFRHSAAPRPHASARTRLPGSAPTGPRLAAVASSRSVAGRRGRRRRYRSVDPDGTLRPPLRGRESASCWSGVPDGRGETILAAGSSVAAVRVRAKDRGPTTAICTLRSRPWTDPRWVRPARSPWRRWVNSRGSPPSPPRGSDPGLRPRRTRHLLRDTRAAGGGGPGRALAGPGVGVQPRRRGPVRAERSAAAGRLLLRQPRPGLGRPRRSAAPGRAGRRDPVCAVWQPFRRRSRRPPSRRTSASVRCLLARSGSLQVDQVGPHEGHGSETTVELAAAGPPERRLRIEIQSVRRPPGKLTCRAIRETPATEYRTVTVVVLPPTRAPES